MHDVGSEEFQRSSIYRLDSLEMRLRRHLGGRADRLRSSPTVAVNGWLSATNSRVPLRCMATRD